MSSIYSVFTPLADFFFYILKFLHENLGISWSWSIVLLTVIVRIALIPLDVAPDQEHAGDAGAAAAIEGPPGEVQERSSSS